MIQYLNFVKTIGSRSIKELKISYQTSKKSNLI